jgi:hypothetical protein
VNKKAGRKPREYDKSIFEGLCEIQCTVDEMESVLRTDQRTLDKWCKRTYKDSFSTTYKRYSSSGKTSLRRFQFNQSKRNASMAIWLGKQWLGQCDKIDHLENKMNTVIGVFNDLNRLIKKEDRADPKTVGDNPTS